MKQVSPIGELRRETVAEVCGLPYWELCYENDGADLDADAQQYRLDVRTAAEYLLGVGAKLDERATANDVLRAASDYAADRLGKFPEEEGEDGGNYIPLDMQADYVLLEHFFRCMTARVKPDAANEFDR